MSKKCCTSDSALLCNSPEGTFALSCKWQLCLSKKTILYQINHFFYKNICTFQKFVVPLHPLLTKSRESVAQQVEHIPFKDGVLGSSPSWFTESSSLAALFVVIYSPCLFIFLVPSNKALQFCLQNYCFFLTCARKISLIVPLTKNYLHISKK